MLGTLVQLYRSFPLAITIFCCLVETGNARRSIPDDNLAYPVLITLNTGDTGSGFYLDIGNTLYLVTAKHVFFDPETHALRGQQVDPQTRNITHKASATCVSYSKNLTDPTPIVFTVDLSNMLKNGDLIPHPSEDVAVLKIGTTSSGPGTTGQPGSLSFIPGVTMQSSGKTGPVVVSHDSVRRFNDVLVGNDVILFGYPTSLGIPQRPQFDTRRPLLRKGVVAGLNFQKRSIILDCPVYQGNSGGPAIEIEMDDKKFLTWNFYVIGVVSEFVPFEDVWLNLCERYLNTTMLNSGYSVVVPMDFVLEIAK